MRCRAVRYTSDNVTGPMQRINPVALRPARARGSALAVLLARVLGALRIRAAL
jgi:hypothetical protein